MDSNRDPFAVAALVGAGTLFGHELGYLLGAGSDAGHDYFALIGPLALVGVVAAVWMSAVSVMRRGRSRVPSVGTLAAAQSILYLLFEIGERAVGATETDLVSVPVAAGLFAQPVVAWLAARTLRFAARVLATFLDGVALATFFPRPPAPTPVFVLSSTGRLDVAARAPPLAF